ncbi:hypothetical protein NDU88_007149 [Pleurodeles waltl]|uniref:Centromere protein H n=1 Tax=Pleurodeles waltl TaxID=8319 RepID=A0AAV7VPM3_PLEWA|nr:hypothetical protein NDU88_007148 [Pleurodeles waltl]KAJ1203362.1 hypothetical protein NDU88_007149 [Pleurodeles waltl]
MLRACSTDRCRHFTILWQLPNGSRPRGQAPEGAAGRIECGARSRAVLLLFFDRARPRRFLGVVVGVWDVLMAPKPIRTPRSLRARQSQDPGGTRKDKKPPVPGLKEHSNPYAKGAQQKITNMEKDARNSVPTMFASMMRIKQMPPEKVAHDSQSSVPGVDGGQVSVAAISLEVLTPIYGPAETPLLDLIYRTMVQNHEQAQRESRKVKSANRQLQLSIKKVVKSCQDIGTRIASMETRTEELETEVRAATAQTTTEGQQISDIQWKLEDAENHQRWNNLRILGIAEDLEGQDTRAYIVSLFKKAFPDLTGWD